MPLNEYHFRDGTDSRVIQAAIRFIDLVEASGIIFDPHKIIESEDMKERLKALSQPVLPSSHIYIHFYYHSLQFYLDDEDVLIMKYEEYWDDWETSNDSREIRVTPETNYSEFVNRIVELN